MSEDIVDRLKSAAIAIGRTRGRILFSEAAEEIRQLCHDNDRLQSVNTELANEVEQLRAFKEQCEKQVPYCYGRIDSNGNIQIMDIKLGSDFPLYRHPSDHKRVFTPEHIEHAKTLDLAGVDICYLPFRVRDVLKAAILDSSANP